MNDYKSHTLTAPSSPPDAINDFEQDKALTFLPK
jgi:hypothetical protein